MDSMILVSLIVIPLLVSIIIMLRRVNDALSRIESRHETYTIIQDRTSDTLKEMRSEIYHDLESVKYSLNAIKNKES